MDPEEFAFIVQAVRTTLPGALPFTFLLITACGTGRASVVLSATGSLRPLVMLLHLPTLTVLASRLQVEWVASHGHKLLPLYIPNAQSGQWRHCRAPVGYVPGRAGQPEPLHIDDDTQLF